MRFLPEVRIHLLCKPSSNQLKGKNLTAECALTNYTAGKFISAIHSVTRCSTFIRICLKISMFIHALDYEDKLVRTTLTRTFQVCFWTCFLKGSHTCNWGSIKKRSTCQCLSYRKYSTVAAPHDSHFADLCSACSSFLAVSSGITIMASSSIIFSCRRNITITAMELHSILISVSGLVYLDSLY